MQAGISLSDVCEIKQQVKVLTTLGSEAGIYASQCDCTAAICFTASELHHV